MRSDYLDLAPVRRVRGTVRLPGSKSISNRILLLAALARGETRIRDLLESEDTQVMLEALRVLGENLVGTLQVVAKDVKVQVAFNAEAVARYRLIGYENRLLANEDFANDAVDSGDIGAGHYVTALYELELREGNEDANLAEVRLRYKEPEGDTSTEFHRPFVRTAVAPTFEAASADLRYAAAVAEFAEILAKHPNSAGARFDEVSAIAGAARNAIRWFPTLSASTNAISTSRLSSLPLPRFSCQRKAIQVRSAMVSSETV